MEAEIEEMKSRVRDLETALLAFVSVEESARLSRELKENRAVLDELLKEWEETSQLIAHRLAREHWQQDSSSA